MGSIRKLAGATIGMNEAPKYMEAFNKTELKTTAGIIAISEEGSEVMFDRLYKGEYHAIVVDMAAAMYNMR